MGIRALIGIQLALLGCGGSDAEGPPRLEGTWGIELNANCLIGTSFLESGGWESDFICQLADGRIGIEADVGVFGTTGNQLTTRTTHATCPSRDTFPVTVAFELLDGDLLSIVTPDGVLVFERLPEEIERSPVVAAFGCFDEQGLFSESPLVEL